MTDPDLDPIRWFTAQNLRHIELIIRDTLDPLADKYRARAHQLGSAPEVRLDRAHHIGRSQGLQDAAFALLAAFGVERLEPVDGRPTYQPPAPSSVSPTNRRANVSARWTPDPDQGR